MYGAAAAAAAWVRLRSGHLPSRANVHIYLHLVSRSSSADFRPIPLIAPSQLRLEFPVQKIFRSLETHICISERAVGTSIQVLCSPSLTVPGTEVLTMPSFLCLYLVGLAFHPDRALQVQPIQYLQSRTLLLTCSCRNSSRFRALGRAKSPVGKGHDESGL